MNALFTFLLAIGLVLSSAYVMASPAHAETENPAAQAAPGAVFKDNSPSPDANPTTNAEPKAPPAVPEAHLIVIDKRTARKHDYTVLEGRSFTHESLQVNVRRCWKEPDTATGRVIYPEQAALIDITENGADQAAHPVFSGWLYAHKSEISNLQDQAYDVTLLSCNAKNDEVPPPAQKKKPVEIPVDDTPPSD